MDRRKRLATAGAISLTASAAIVAVASGVGLFGLTNDSPRVGTLSPIDATRSTSSVITEPTSGGGTTLDPAPSTRQDGADDPANHDGTGDRANHDANSDRGSSSTPTNTVPEATDGHRGPSPSGTDVDTATPGSSSPASDHDDD